MAKSFVALSLAVVASNWIPLYLALMRDDAGWFDEPTVRAVSVTTIGGILLWLASEWSKRRAERREAARRKVEQDAEIDAKTQAAARAAEDRMRVRIEDSSALQAEQMRQTIKSLSETIESLAEERDKMAKAADDARVAQMTAHEAMWRALADVENLNRERTIMTAQIKTQDQTIASLREQRDAQDRENASLRDELKKSVEAFTRQIQAEEGRGKKQ